MIKKVSFLWQQFRKLLGWQGDLFVLKTRFPTVAFGRNVIVNNLDKANFGPHTKIADQAIINCGGEWSDQSKAGFSCGKNCYIGPGSVIFAAGGVEMGDHVGLGPLVNVISHQQHYTDPEKTFDIQTTEYRKVRIGHNVMVCSNATLLPGITIGDNSVIAANALVSKDVPPNTMVMGIPAKVVKTLR